MAAVRSPAGCVWPRQRAARCCVLPTAALSSAACASDMDVVWAGIGGIRSADVLVGRRELARGRKRATFCATFAAAHLRSLRRLPCQARGGRCARRVLDNGGSVLDIFIKRRRRALCLASPRTLAYPSAWHHGPSGCGDNQSVSGIFMDIHRLAPATPAARGELARRHWRRHQRRVRLALSAGRICCSRTMSRAGRRGKLAGHRRSSSSRSMTSFLCGASRNSATTCKKQNSKACGRQKAQNHSACMLPLFLRWQKRRSLAKNGSWARQDAPPGA